MTDKEIALDNILKRLELALQQLEQAEAEWEEALNEKKANQPGLETGLLEDLLHIATHETASTLGMALWDIRGLIPCLDFFLRYAPLSPVQVRHVIREGWSTTLLQSLHQAHPDQQLDTLSVLVKSILHDWEALPSLSKSLKKQLLKPEDSTAD